MFKNCCGCTNKKVPKNKKNNDSNEDEAKKGAKEEPEKIAEEITIKITVPSDDNPKDKEGDSIMKEKEDTVIKEEEIHKNKSPVSLIKADNAVAEAVCSNINIEMSDDNKIVIENNIVNNEINKNVENSEILAECNSNNIPNTTIEEKSDEVNSKAIIIEPKRISITPSLVIENIDDEDEVFVDGIEPQTPRGDMCTPYPKKKGSLPGLSGQPPLPQWFSQDDDEEEIERGGTQEPPATPVGRDELAMRRHRFFSDLLIAAQAATEHRVRFDPLGPTIACDGDLDSKSHPTKELESLVSRLERVTTRLEQTVGTSILLPKLLSESEATEENNEEKPISEPPPVPPPSATGPSPYLNYSNMSVAGFRDIVQGPLAQFITLSRKIGGDVAAQADFVEKAFNAQLVFLDTASVSSAPSPSQQMDLLQPTSQQISQIQEFREKHRASPLFNHLSAISESIPALGWVCVTPTPGPHVKEMNDAGQFYTNRVLKEWKGKNETHVEWTKAWIQTLTELQQFIKQHHTTGLVWAGKGCPPPPPGKGCPPPPPPGLPPPPPVLPVGDVTGVDDGSNDRSALFAEINQGEGITRSLKKVTSEMQTHKNPTLRTGPAPFKAPAAPTTKAVKAPVSNNLYDKPPVFTRDGKKWLVEYQKGNANLLVENAEMNNVVYMFRCQNSTITVKGKLNSVVLDSCKKCSIVFDSLVSSVEFVNCQSVQMQVLGKVPTISIDKTDGCQMYLSSESLATEIISSKSSEMNVMIPKGNGDYAEQPVPEQFKTTISGTSLSTVAIESLG